MHRVKKKYKTLLYDDKTLILILTLVPISEWLDFYRQNNSLPDATPILFCVIMSSPLTPLTFSLNDHEKVAALVWGCLYYFWPYDLKEFQLWLYF